MIDIYDAEQCNIKFASMPLDGLAGNKSLENECIIIRDTNDKNDNFRLLKDFSVGFNILDGYVRYHMPNCRWEIKFGFEL